MTDKLDKLKIEKNIPITRQRHKRDTYADLLNKMDVGDSIKADFKTIDQLSDNYLDQYKKTLY